TMIVTADGSYRALTTGGASTEGKFYLQDGQLRYRSSRTTGAASISEVQGTTRLTMMPADPKYHAGRAEYERVKEGHFRRAARRASGLLEKKGPPAARRDQPA